MGNYSNYTGSIAIPTGGPDLSKINPAKEGLSAGFKNALNLASTGAQVAGPWGAAAGFVAGIGTGIWKGLQARKQKLKEDVAGMKSWDQNMFQFNQEAGATGRAAGAINDGGYFSNAFMAKKGGNLPVSIDAFQMEVESMLNDMHKARSTKQFRDGGAVNVIPKGTYHGRKNNIGDKGIPVVIENEEGKLEKVAEIEHNEIIFTKSVTDEIERMAKRYEENPDDEENLLSLGSLIYREVTENTIDNQGDLL